MFSRYCLNSEDYCTHFTGMASPKNRFHYFTSMFYLFRWFLDNSNFCARSYIKSKRNSLHGRNVGFRHLLNWFCDWIFSHILFPVEICFSPLLCYFLEHLSFLYGWKFFFKFSYMILMYSTILRLIVNSLYQTLPLGYTSKDRKSCNSSRRQKNFTKLCAIHIVENVIKSHWFKIIMRIKQVQMIPMVPVVPGALRKRLDNWLGNLEITSRNILETLKIVFYIYYLTPLCGP